MELNKLSAEKVQLRTGNARLHSQLQYKDAQLQQQQERLALQQQHLEQQYHQAAKLRKQCEEQQRQIALLEQVRAARPKQQQKPDQDACNKVTNAPVAVPASPLAGCNPRRVALSPPPSAADGVSRGEGSAFLESADGVKQPEAPGPVDSRATYSPRSSTTSSDDGRSSSDYSIPKQQTASAASSWWWWSPTTTSITSSTTNCTSSTSNSNEGKSSYFSSWWAVDAAVDIAAGAAGDILYL